MTPAPAKHYGPRRGELGLAKFHRILRGASALTSICLMLTSMTALYWFAGVIGMPTIARITVALAFEVMTATLGASATTASRIKRNGERGTDWSAWAGFAFFMMIGVLANVMHVLKFIKLDDVPAYLPHTVFIAGACVFAAACAMGGTWGVHRYGWLRANGADAEWTDTDDGVMTETSPATRPAPRPRKPRTTSAQVPADAKSSATTDAGSRTNSRTAAPDRESQRAPMAAVADVPADADAKTRVFDACDKRVAAGRKVVAAQIQRELKLDHLDPSTPRLWVQQWKTARAGDPGDPEPEPASAKSVTLRPAENAADVA